MKSGKNINYRIVKREYSDGTMRLYIQFSIKGYDVNPFWLDLFGKRSYRTDEIEEARKQIDLIIDSENSEIVIVGEQEVL